MAIEQTSLSPLPTIFPFLGLDQLGLDRSNVPRAEVIYSGILQVVAASGVGDTQRLDITCELPQNFSYAMAECHIDITTAAGTLNTWNDDGILFLVDANNPARSIFVSSPLHSQGVIDTEMTPKHVYNLENIMKGVLVPPPNSIGAKVGLTFNNTTEGSVAATTSFYIRLYQFDIEQAHHFAVNTPDLIR